MDDGQFGTRAPSTYKGVAVPEQLSDKWLTEAAAWWRIGVQDATSWCLYDCDYYYNEDTCPCPNCENARES